MYPRLKHLWQEPRGSDVDIQETYQLSYKRKAFIRDGVRPGYWFPQYQWLRFVNASFKNCNLTVG